MKIKIYASYGILAHEKEPLYTFGAPAGEIHDELTVEVPHVVGYNDFDEPFLDLYGMTYRLTEVLSNKGDNPALIWCNDQGKHFEILEVL